MEVDERSDGESCPLVGARNGSAAAECVEEGDGGVPGGGGTWRSMMLATVLEAGGVEREVVGGQLFYAEQPMLETCCTAEADEERPTTASSGEGWVEMFVSSVEYGHRVGRRESAL